MGEAFFIPTDPERFFRDNDLGALFPVPAPMPEGGLRFEGRCLSCSTQTDEIEVLVGGVRGEGGVSSWEQPVPMCARCRAQGWRRRRIEGRLGLAALVCALGLGVGAGAGAASWQGWGVPGVALAFGVGVLVGWLVWASVRARVQRAVWGGEQGAPYQGVELLYFRDPRKGAEARFLCLRIENPAEASSFGRLNPQAMPLAVWEASYGVGASSRSAGEVG